MIDLHCHILPGIDDGPANIDDAVAMCRHAAEDGIQTIVATPHFWPGRYETSYEQIESVLYNLRRRLTEENINITILAGAEVGVTPELILYLDQRKDLTINSNRKFFFAEFISSVVPPNWQFFLGSAISRGYVPILAHPERSQWFLRHLKELAEFVENGGLVQITAGSLIGDMGAEIRDAAAMLLKSNLVHVIASDAHSPYNRPPILKKAVDKASDIIGEDRAYAMVTQVPAAIIAGGRVIMPPPVVPSRSKKTWKQLIFG